MSEPKTVQELTDHYCEGHCQENPSHKGIFPDCTGCEIWKTVEPILKEYQEYVEVIALNVDPYDIDPKYESIVDRAVVGHCGQKLKF